MTAIKKGKKYCPHSKSLSEKEIENAFVDAFNLMVNKQKEVVEEFLKNVETVLDNTDTAKELKKAQNEVNRIENNINKLLDLHLENIITREDFEEKYAKLTKELDEAKAKEKELQEILNKEGNLQNRINTFRKIFETNKTMDEFDREIFESVIEEVIIGSEESTNTITFIFRTGLEVKKSRGSEDLYLYSTHDTRWVRDIDVKVVVLDITGFSRLHSTCLLERKGKNAYVGTYQWYISG